MKRRVVVTGLGAVTPVGLTVKESWENIVAGKSGVAPLTLFDVSDFTVRFGASVKNFDVTSVIPKKDAKKMDTFIHYGIAAAKEAIEDAGLVITDENAERIGVAIGSGIGGLPGIEAGYDSYLNGGPRKISPFFVPSNIINMISGNLSIMYGMKGPNTAIVTACSTGTHCISAAGRMIQYGDADVMVAGGAEAVIGRIGIAGFCAAKAMSTNFNDTPEKASRPYDKDRDGFVMGEGAAIVVLEEYEHAKARGAKIYAEVAGYGLTGDAYHITAPAEGAEGGYRAMKMALKHSGMDLTEIDYVNAHGTSTPKGDEGEAGAVERAFGEHAKNMAMSSTKSAVGHLLGAAGAIESAFCALAIRDQVMPPTLNLDNPSFETVLDLIPHKAKKGRVRAAMSNSFGFGGTNASLVLKEVQ